MKSRQPTTPEIDELVAFLPGLYAEGFAPVERWGGGAKRKDGAISVAWPEYNPLVVQFFSVASKECWCDYEYLPEEAGRMLQDDNTVSNASLAEIGTMLTFCVRGERFCDGHWGSMIRAGHIRRLLQRLSELRSEDALEDSPADIAIDNSEP
jgi:hypothetical protein